MYQVARSRAIGRGVAVVVRYSDGRFEVREATTESDVSLVPASSCTAPADRWGTDPKKNVLIEAFELKGQSPYQLVTVEFSNSVAEVEGSALTNVLGSSTVADVCFTPNGTMMYREGDGAFAMGARTLMIRVVQASGSVEVGISRTVFVLPNGVARVAARTAVT